MTGDCLDGLEFMVVCRCIVYLEMVGIGLIRWWQSW